MLGLRCASNPRARQDRDGRRCTLGSIRPALQWAAAVCASLILALVLDQVAVPASFLVGPMLIGIFCALGGATIRLPRSAFVAGQALIGCLIARSVVESEEVG